LALILHKKGEKNMIKLGYKVCRINGRMTNFPLGSISTDGEQIEYKKGEWVEPNPGCGPLAVFKSRIAAILYKKNFAGISGRIFRCLYEPTKGDALFTPYTKSLITDLEEKHRFFIMKGHTKLAKRVLIF
jgi:hypothetical protein